VAAGTGSQCSLPSELVQWHIGRREASIVVAACRCPIQVGKKSIDLHSFLPSKNYATGHAKVKYLGRMHCSARHHGASIWGGGKCPCFAANRFRWARQCFFASHDWRTGSAKWAGKIAQPCKRRNAWPICLAPIGVSLTQYCLCCCCGDGY
jgi:hypothetical protein